MNRMAKKHLKKDNLRGYSARKVETRELIERFLIVCEGEKTEPNYFNAFRVPKDVINVRGLRFNPSKLVEKAQELRKQEDYDQVWCVFDRDAWTKEDFNYAITKAKQEGIDIAYSNEAFELWYVLHFEFLNTGIPRSDYCKKLNKLLGYKYQKNSQKIYEELEYRQQTAIKNAENLLKQYHQHNPESDNPSTTVHLLVCQLNRFIR